MVLKKIDGISKKQAVGTQLNDASRNRSKKIDGLIGVRKVRDLDVIRDDADNVQSEKNVESRKRQIERSIRLTDAYSAALSSLRGQYGKASKRIVSIRKKIQKKARKAVKSFKMKSRAAVSKFLIFLAWSIGIACVAYLSSAFVILIFKPQNRFIDRFSSLIPIPAVITDRGIIYFDEYQMISSKSDPEKAFTDNIRNIITKRFLELYGMGDAAPEKEELNRIVMKDEGINEIPLARITKIKNEMDKFGFEDIYRKYGDEYNDGEYVSREQAESRFNNQLIEYGGDKLSPVLFGDKGYYIINVVDNRAEPIGIKYVFVKATTFDEYLGSEIKKIKYIKLIR